MASGTRLPAVRRTAGDANRSRPISMIEGPALDLSTQSNVLLEWESSKKAKRRSLLPQFSRMTLCEEKVELGIKEEDERDNGGESTMTTSVDIRDSDESTSRRGIDEDRKAMPPPSKLTRPVSMIPPRGASQFAKTKSKSKSTHAREDSKDKEDQEDSEAARAQSLAALTGAAPATTPSKLAMPSSGLQRTGSTRLPQSPRIGGPAIPSRTTSSRPSHSHSRTNNSMNGSSTSTSIAEKRSSIAKPRPPSQSEQASDTTLQTSPPRSSMMARPHPTSQLEAQPMSPQRTSSLARPRPTSQLQPPSRPAFNTFQQHYSPAKTALPKPPVPPSRSGKHSSVQDDDVAVTFDVAKQQIELLQLSLLHQASSKCMQDYTASAKRQLGRKHTKLRKDYETIRATELVHQRVANLSALEAWCRDPGMLVENLQILSLVYSDLTSLMEEGSRHADVVSMFELWMSEAENPEPGTFIQPLPDEWKNAQASLALKLRSIQRNLGVLPPPPESDGEGSGLEVVLKGCKTLVDGMMKELEVMVKLEKELLARERNRIEEDVKALALDEVAMQPVWIPAWQKV